MNRNNINQAPNMVHTTTQQDRLRDNFEVQLCCSLHLMTCVRALSNSAANRQIALKRYSGSRSTLVDGSLRNNASPVSCSCT